MSDTTADEAETTATSAARLTAGRSALGLMGDVLANPVLVAGQGMALIRATADLRRCQRVGPRARLFGRCKVANYGTIEIGERLLMYGNPVRCDLNAHAGGRLEIGDGVFINYGCSFSAHTLVHVGDRCQIGQYTLILDCDYHDPDGSEGHGRPAPIVIGKRVWMGARVTVLKGVTIGSGSVIGAGSVVTRDIPPGVLAAGVPAAVVKPL